MQYTYEESLKFNNIFSSKGLCYYCEKEKPVASFIEGIYGLELCEDCTLFMDMTNYDYKNYQYSLADVDHYNNN